MPQFSSSIQEFATRLSSMLEARRAEPDTQTAPATGGTIREIGLVAGSMVATQTGWCAIERIMPGDQLLTFDNGMKPVVENRFTVIRRAELPEAKAFLMYVPAGALGNRAEMHVLPMQELVLESDRAEACYGDPFVLIPALLLEGYKGIRKTPITGDLRVHMLTFTSEQIIQINGALLALASSKACLSPFAETIAAESQRYPRLTHAQLRQAIDRRAICRDAARAAFGAQSVDETYAALTARM
ncbi:MAG: Hint domain-containing protein [Roseinatronobacter sp.]|nr:Hint domain-containing protein [Roseinatronobacter sp.]